MVKLIALTKTEVAEVVSALRDSWVPKREVPATTLSHNGPHFTASVVQDFCKRVTARKIYITPYYPQGNSTVEELHTFF